MQDDGTFHDRFNFPERYLVSSLAHVLQNRIADVYSSNKHKFWIQPFYLLLLMFIPIYRFIQNYLNNNIYMITIGSVHQIVHII